MRNRISNFHYIHKKIYICRKSCSMDNLWLVANNTKWAITMHNYNTNVHFLPKWPPKLVSDFSTRLWQHVSFVSYQHHVLGSVLSRISWHKKFIHQGLMKVIFRNINTRKLLYSSLFLNRNNSRWLAKLSCTSIILE